MIRGCVQRLRHKPIEGSMTMRGARGRTVQQTAISRGILTGMCRSHAPKVRLKGARDPYWATVPLGSAVMLPYGLQNGLIGLLEMVRTETYE